MRAAWSLLFPHPASYPEYTRCTGRRRAFDVMESTAQFDAARVHVLDGGLATELERRGYDISGPLWSAHVLDTAPEAIQQLHLDYLRAGADCIVTASYQVSAMGYAALGRPHEDAARAIRKSIELAEAARAEFAHESARPVTVAVSLGPYGAVLHNGAEFHGRYDIGMDDLVAFHGERFAAVAGAGMDIVAMETIPSLEEARAVLAAMADFSALRGWMSFTCKDHESVAHSEPLSECVAAVNKSEQIAAVGMNCVQPRFVARLIGAARTATEKPIFAYPNSGEVWDVSARAWRGQADVAGFGRLAEEWYAAGAQAVGGCCRTGPEHIRAVRAAWAARGTGAGHGTVEAMRQ